MEHLEKQRMQRMPKKPTSRQNAYICKAGELAAMAELALRGYMVALPEIDNGDDILVVNEHTGQLWRVQVKGSTAQQKGEYQPVVHEKQIRTGSNPDRYFIFSLRREMEREPRWRFVVISREQLKKFTDCGLGSLEKKSKKRRTFTITFKKKDAGQVNGPWNGHMEDWDIWPRLDHERIAAEKKAAAEQSADTSNEQCKVVAAETPICFDAAAPVRV